MTLDASAIQAICDALIKTASQKGRLGVSAKINQSDLDNARNTGILKITIKSTKVGKVTATYAQEKQNNQEYQK